MNLPAGIVMARTKETIAEPGAKTGVTRTFASAGTPGTVTDPCWATDAEVASRRVSVISAPPDTISTVDRAVTAWSGDKTGAAARLTATGIGAGGGDVRDAGNVVATKDPPGSGPGVP
jgi:hypothetical protein